MKRQVDHAATAAEIAVRVHRLLTMHDDMASLPPEEESQVMAYVGNFLALGQVHATLGVAQMIEQYSAPLSRKARPESVFVALEEVRNLAAAHARDGAGDEHDPAGELADEILEAINTALGVAR